MPLRPVLSNHLVAIDETEALPKLQHRECKRFYSERWAKTLASDLYQKR